MRKLIYVADDEKNIRNLVRAFFEKEGWSVEVFDNGDLLLDAFLKKASDLVVLDIMMPGSNGFIICTKLREVSDVPIIMLTAKDTEEDYVSGLALGSDDYFTKPFSPVKLTMRVKALFRRVDMFGQKDDATDEIICGDIKISHGGMTAVCKNEPLPLTKTEFSLLSYLAENDDKAVSRQELLNVIWGYDSAVESRATDDAVKRLRRKLTDAGSEVCIDTVWGYGFKIGGKCEKSKKGTRATDF
ncbi:MAG: response regulator transcription factor [Defluviitaleaceae bacterium]|nr:response regulator transcription factor [Defluviitaleaceae bacterium]